MATYTNNLNLIKPLQDENYNVDNFNDNADKIDVAVKDLQDDVLKKSSIISPSFTGEPKAPTPIASDNTKKLATTEFVKRALAAIDLLEAIYPIGAIYLSTIGTSPATLFGGSWTEMQAGRMLLAQGGSYTAGTTGGEAEHALTVDEMPSHNHVWYGGAYGASTNSVATDAGGAKGTLANKKTTYDTGGGQAHNNMPPYLAVYMWKRVS